MVHISDPYWSPGFIGGVITGAVFLFIFLFGGIGGWWFIKRHDKGRSSYDQIGGARLALCLGSFLAVFPLAIGLVTTFPWSAEYHQYRTYSGTVSNVGTRLLAADRATTQSFVVTFQGSPQQYRCDDTRCALVNPGDTLSLDCIKDYQWVGTSGYVCEYRDN